MVIGMSYQMDHIWWASSRLKNSPGLLIGSQCSRTLYRSFIVTLYLTSFCIFCDNDFRGHGKHQFSKSEPLSYCTYVYLSQKWTLVLLYLCAFRDQTHFGINSQLLHSNLRDWSLLKETFIIVSRWLKSWDSFLNIFTIIAFNLRFKTHFGI